MIIATRVLKVRRGESESDALVRIFAPTAEGDVWMCRYDINWSDRRWENVAAGFDSIQSLVLALQMIGTEIYGSDEHRSGRLMWEREGRGYGFPVPAEIRDILIGDDKRFSAA